jgi:hypothetical protein
MLQRAHELMASGNYPAAAEAFEQLARGAEARQHPKTGQLYLQAGRARILAGQKEAGFAHLKRGLGLLAGQPVQLHHAGNRVVSELKEQGMTAEAQEISQWLATSLPVQNEARMESPAKKPILPTKCPGCGGPIRTEDVDWIDEVTAECNWCGSPVRAEN